MQQSEIRRGVIDGRHSLKFDDKINITGVCCGARQYGPENIQTSNVPASACLSKCVDSIDKMAWKISCAHSPLRPARIPPVDIRHRLHHLAKRAVRQGAVHQ